MAKADSPIKTCTQDGCDRPLRARGLCSTHYNQRYQPERHAARSVSCVVCGTMVQRATKGRQPACSTRCRAVIQWGSRCHDGPSAYSWAHDAAQRAARAGAKVIDLFDRIEVFDRDGYRCYLCRAITDPSLSPFSPAYPTVDHVVPLSRGGDHSLGNVRTACLGCNSSKQDQMIKADGYTG